MSGVGAGAGVEGDGGDSVIDLTASAVDLSEASDPRGDHGGRSSEPALVSLATPPRAGAANGGAGAGNGLSDVVDLSRGDDRVSLSSGSLSAEDAVVVDGSDADSDHILSSVRAVRAVFPDVDPNHVYGRLMEVSAEELSEELASAPYPKAAAVAQARVPVADAIADIRRKLSVDQFVAKFMHGKVVDGEGVGESDGDGGGGGAGSGAGGAASSASKAAAAARSSTGEPRSGRMPDWEKEMRSTVSHALLEPFSDVRADVSVLYRQHASHNLLLHFDRCAKHVVDSALDACNGHYFPALVSLSHLPGPRRGDTRWLKRRRRAAQLPVLPPAADEAFERERWVAEHRDSIVDAVVSQWRHKRARYRAASAAGALVECCVCYGDFLEEDAVRCSSCGHSSCVPCARGWATEQAGDGETRIRCVNGECSAEIPLYSLQRVLPGGAYDAHVRRVQQDELRRANIPGLAGCPFCDFVVQAPPANVDRVLHCLNPKCGKVSCRLCKEESHIPLRCEEVEKGEDIKKRTFLEDQMTNALLVQCWKCRA